MKGPAIFQGFDSNILRDAVISASVAPLTGFPLETLGYLRPDFRVRWDTGTVTIEFTPTGAGSPGSSGRTGDILVIPASNLVDGFVSLTNDAGLDIPVPVPLPLRNGIPRTIVVDVSLLEPDDSKRVDSVPWQLVIASNPLDVVIGGAIALYGPKTYLVDRDCRWGYTVSKRGLFIEAQNAYGTRARQNMGTMERSIEVSTLATDVDQQALEDWFDGCNGQGLAGLLWFDPNIEDAFLGYWSEGFARTHVFHDVHEIRIPFVELSKGLPLFMV